MCRRILNEQASRERLDQHRYFTAIYFIVIFAAASIGFIPIFIPLISVIVPLVGGIPMMLFFSKIKSLVC